MQQLGEEIAEVGPAKISDVANEQIALQDRYYRGVLRRAKTIFRCAVAAVIVGLAFFLVAVVAFFLFETFISKPPILMREAQAIATVGVISGALFEAIAAIIFYVYAKTTDQLADFHYRIERTQRYVLANSICEELEDTTKQETRAFLIQAIANPSDTREKAKLDRADNDEPAEPEPGKH